MTDIIERLEKAEGPDRPLDCYIHAEVIRRSASAEVCVVGPPTYDLARYFFNPAPEKLNWLGYDLLNVAPHYTASIDAALTLVPEDYGWRIEWVHKVTNKAWATCGPVGAQEQAHGATPAIALCIAALKARAVSS